MKPERARAKRKVKKGGKSEPEKLNAASATGNEEGPAQRTDPVEMERALRIPAILLEGDDPSPAPAAGSGRGFVPEPARPAPAPALEQRVLPESYGTGRLLLTARDPYCLHAYWDAAFEQERAAAMRPGADHLIIRVYEGQSGGPPAQEIQALPGLRHWFVHVARAGIGYSAELGYYEREHSWHTLATSPPVATPREQVAQTAEPIRFATVGAPDYDQRAEEAGKEVSNVPPGPPLFQPEPHPAAEQAKPPPAAPSRFPPPGPVPAAFLKASEPAPPPPAQAQSPAAEFTPKQVQALAALLGQEKVAAQMLEQFGGKLPEDLAWLVPAQPNLPASAELAEVTSSPAGGALPERKGFWFSVNAELVIYGATDPNAKVTIGGRPIRLRPDGSFSYRFVLPDGQYEMPIAAVATEGEVRQAELRFFRATEYFGEVSAHPPEPGLKPPRSDVS